MAIPLTEELKRRAEKRCADYKHLELYDPSTVLTAEGRTLVLVKDKPTGLPVWLELPPEA